MRTLWYVSLHTCSVRAGSLSQHVPGDTGPVRNKMSIKFYIPQYVATVYCSYTRSICLGSKWVVFNFTSKYSDSSSSDLCILWYILYTENQFSTKMRHKNAREAKAKREAETAEGMRAYASERPRRERRRRSPGSPSRRARGPRSRPRRGRGRGRTSRRGRRRRPALG